MRCVVFRLEYAILRQVFLLYATHDAPIEADVYPTPGVEELEPLEELGLTLYIKRERSLNTQVHFMVFQNLTCVVPII